MRVLVYSDGPSVPTGFGVVVKNIFLPLIERRLFEEIAFFAVNYDGSPHGLPVRQWPAFVGATRDPDPYGRNRFAFMALHGTWNFDLLFVLQDHFTVAPFLPLLVTELRKQVTAGQRPPFRTIFYFPLDGRLIKPEWVRWLPEAVEYPVAYLPFARDALCSMLPVLADRVRVIPHGTNPETFFPVPEAERLTFRRNTLQVADDQPLLVSVNRNQPRKDPVSTLQVFARVLEHYPRAVLYMHMNVRDSAGFDLLSVAAQLRIPAGHVRFPAEFVEGIGIPLDQLNLIYNAADVFLVTPRGEGFGLSVTEALCTRRLVIAPAHTSFPWLLADQRGILVPPLTQELIMPLDNDQFRPIADVEATATQVLWALANPDAAHAIAETGYAWAVRQSWRDVICPQWEALFREADAARTGVSNRDALRLKPEDLGL